jgi:hypothetical protein
MKTNLRQSAWQAQGLRLPPRKSRWIPSPFTLYPSSFRLSPSSFTLHPSSFILLPFAFALCLLPTVLHAQGCAMCYNSASAAKAGAKEALANGVLILLVPPMVFFALITVVVYIYRNKFREMSVVSGPSSVARKSNDPEFRRSDGPGAEAPDFGFWSPDHPIRCHGQRTTDHGQRTRKLQGQGN